jgi:hypothetical protein
MNPPFGPTNLPTARLRRMKMSFERIDRRGVAANVPTTSIRCVRRMPGFDSFWLSYRTASAETTLTQGDAASIYAVRYLAPGMLPIGSHPDDKVPTRAGLG